MSVRRSAAATAFLFSMIAPASSFAGMVQYRFHAVDPVIEVASGDVFVADLLRSSAATADLHGTIRYDRDQPMPVIEFSGSAWGVSFSFSDIRLDLGRAGSPGWGTRDHVTVGPVHTGSPETAPALGDHRLMLAGLQFSNDPPWISPDLGGSSLPPDLSLLLGTTGLLEMCFDGSGTYYTCLFIHGVEVTEVPLPAGGGLMVSALASLAALRRFRRV